MGAFSRTLKRLGLRRRPGAPATITVADTKRGRRHWGAGAKIAPDPLANFRVYIHAAGGGGSGFEVEPVADVTVRCDRPYPQPDHAPTRGAGAPPTPPFDPVRAWTDVGLAWLRCAHTFAEIPAQLALYHRVRVVGLL